MQAKPTRRHFSAGVAVPVSAVALTLAALGCGSSSKSPSTIAASTPAPSTPATAAPVASGTVRLTADPGGALKFAQTAASAKAGTVTLVMNNPSSAGVQHGISVEGNGIDKTGPIVSPGKAATLSVNLKPGTYTFYCPFDGHKQAGMIGKLTVQ